MLGIVTGLQSEAKLVASPSCAVVSGGGRPEATRRKIEALVARGVGGLVSFGIAGGLDPALRTGDIVISATVIDESGTAYVGNPAWLERALALRAASFAGHAYASDRIVETVAEKQRLFTTFNALSVDMESHHMARIAERERLPFLVIRAISDTAAETLPGGLAAGVDEEGATQILPILSGLLFGRLGVLSVIKAGRSAGAALRSLGQAQPILAQLAQ
ncbi:MAG TPA: hypothetical protein VM639_18455 [Dongiaceae bacterium]|nr:hypothetical protein [Dongiaceae bacterium]